MKPILIISEYPVLKEKQIQMEDKMKFFQKRLKTILDEREQMGKDFWKEIELYLEENALLKNASAKCLTINDGVLYEKDSNKQDSFTDMIRGLFT